MRVAVVDIGTNSTRLLVADVGDGTVTQLVRESTVTRLGEGVDATGRLADRPMQRVFDTLERYSALINEHDVSATTAVLTSAVRDAANGARFAAAVRERFDLDAHTIDGDEEAALTFAGATSERPRDGRDTVVIDIGGGSTEFVVGCNGEMRFHVSTQAGVVRQTERHVRHDPPTADELRALSAEAREIFTRTIPQELRRCVQNALAVAGTATSSASIELGLEPYDSARVHGHVLTLGACEALLDRLVRLTNDERRGIVGLHPDRAPTIVAGVALLIEAVRIFGLDAVEVSEHDILRGAALRLAASSRRAA